MLAINQPRVSHLDRASRIWSTISLDKAVAWHSFISGSSSSGLNADFLNHRSALSNPTPQRRVLWIFIITARTVCHGVPNCKRAPSDVVDKGLHAERQAHRSTGAHAGSLLDVLYGAGKGRGESGSSTGAYT